VLRKKISRSKLICAGIGTLLFGCCLVWLFKVAGHSEAGPKQWLVISSPIFSNGPSPTGGITTVSFLVSNAGPRTIEPGLSWFEFAKKKGVWSPGEYRTWLSLPVLPAHKAARVSGKLPEGLTVDEDLKFCCEISWHERGSLARRAAQKLDNSDNPNIRPWNINWMRPWQSEPLTNGVAFTANPSVSEYFRSVYGLDAAYLQRLEQARKVTIAGTNGSNIFIIKRGLTPEQEFTNKVWIHYLKFRRSL